MNMQATRTLQELIAEAAMERVGETYRGRCGDFIKEILSAHGLNIPLGVGGGLRRAGREIPFEERKAGDVFFVYSNEENYHDNLPFTAGILVEKGEYVGIRKLTVIHNIFTVIPAAIPRIAPITAPYDAAYDGSVRVRRLEW